MKWGRDETIAVGLTVPAYLLAVLGQSIAAGKPQWVPPDSSSWIEVVGFITGVQAVYLVVRERMMNWPIGILNVLLYGYFFFVVAKHFANGALQIMFLIYQVEGWYRWRFGGEGRTESKIRHITRNELLVMLALVPLITFALVPLLEKLGGQVPFWDALTTGLSVSAQLLLNRKVLQNWLFWIVADVIYVPLYVYRQYWPTAILYVLFLFLAVAGYLQWRRSLLTPNPDLHV